MVDRFLSVQDTKVVLQCAVDGIGIVSDKGVGLAVPDGRRRKTADSLMPWNVSEQKPLWRRVEMR
jgi:hypothetical protein